MGISLSNKPDNMANSVGRIRCKCKIRCLFGCPFYYHDNFQPKQYIWGTKEKLDIMNELKTPVKKAYV